MAFALKYELRPLSLGEVLDRTVQVYRSRFLLFAGIAAFPTAVFLVIELLSVVVGKGLFNAFGPHSDVSTVCTLGTVLVDGLVYSLLLCISVAATCQAVSSLYLDRPVTILGAYGLVRSHWFRSISVVGVAAVYACGPGVALIIVAPRLAGRVAAALDPGSAFAGFLPASALALGIAVSIWTIWATLRFSVALPVSILEDRRVPQSLKRSVLLTEGGRGRIFVMLLLVGAIWMVVIFHMQLLIMFTSLSGKNGLLYFMTVPLGMVLVNVLVVPVYGIAIALFYYDGRVRKEGFDVEWMMERAGLGAVGPAVVGVDEGIVDTASSS